MTSVSLRNTLFLTGLAAAAAFVVPSALAQDDTACIKCNKSIGTGDPIEGECLTPDSTSENAFTCVLNPDQQEKIYLNIGDGDPDNDVICTRLFWTAEGKYYPHDTENPEVYGLDVEDGTTLVATSWYHCQGICKTPPCGGGVGVYAIDMNAGEWITDRVVEAISPWFALGSCGLGAPCVTLAHEPVQSLTAYSTVDDLEFEVWDNFDPGDRMIESSAPSGLGSPQTALYAEPEPVDHCTRLEAFVGLNGCGPLIDQSLWEVVLFERGNTFSELDRICQYVYDLEQCGCIKGYCPSLDLLFDVGDLATTPEIAVIDSLSGKVAAVAEQWDAKTRIMRVPMDKQLLEHGVLFFDFGKGKARVGRLGTQVLEPK